MFNLEEVKRLAKLSRLELAEKELITFQKELSSILDYFEKLKSVNTENVLPTAYTQDVKNVWREDEQKIKCDEETIAKMITQAPNHENGYIKIKTPF